MPYMVYIEIVDEIQFAWTDESRTKRFTGVEEVYYDFLKNNLDYRREWKDGLKHGLWLSYRRDGTCYFRENFDHGLLHGTSEHFYMSGNLMDKTQWVHGKRHGLEEVYHQNGKLDFNCTWVNGLREGLELRFDNKGNFKYTQVWSGGLLNGTKLQFWDSGLLWKRTRFRNNLKCGLSEDFTSKEKVHWSCYYWNDWKVSEEYYRERMLEIEVDKVL
jgi:antitoxin component YwqK of YwqJK toxin-antitoxin module